jgi:hypothetical protein
MTVTREHRRLLDEQGYVRLEGYIEPARESARPIDSRLASSHAVAGVYPRLSPKISVSSAGGVTSS